MKFFRFIALSKISVACILIISAMSSSAQHIRDWSTLLPELNFISGPWYAAQHIFKLTKGQKTPELYLFLKEAQTQNTRNYQQPPENFEKFFKVYTNAPVIESYLGYYKLHNISLSSWRPAIAWSKIILRVHDDDKVTGWFLDSDENGATYNTVRASEDITSAFLGEVVNNSIKFHRVTETGDTPKDGYEKCDDLRWNGAHNVLIGKWNGGSKHVNPKEQKGNVQISMHRHYNYDFNIKDAINKFQKQPEKWNDKYIESLLDQKKRPLGLGFDDMELIIAWDSIKAWDSYIPTIADKEIKEFFEKEKNNILNVRVYLQPNFYSDTQGGNAVPMQFGLNSLSTKQQEVLWANPMFGIGLEADPMFGIGRLNISIGIPDSTFWSQQTFWGNNYGNSDWPKYRISKIAHEILGHGLFMRYASNFVDYKKDKTKDVFVYSSLEGHMLAEALATAVEYTVAKNLNEPDITQYKDIESFVGPQNGTTGRYTGDKSPKGIYWNGIGSAIKNEYIDENGIIQWSKFKAAIAAYQNRQTLSAWHG